MLSSFDVKIARASERESRGFSVGNLIMNLEGQKQKLMLTYIMLPFVHCYVI